MRRVVVTGMGMVTPVGRDLEIDLVGAPGGPERRRPDHPVRRRDLPDPDRRRGPRASGWTTTSTTPRGGTSTAGTPSSPSPPPRWPSIDSGLADDRTTLDRARFGVYLGSGEGQQDFPRFVDLVHRTARDGQGRHRGFTRLGLHELHPIREAEQEPGTPAGHLASLFGAQGPNANCLTACAASSQAIGEAVEMIRRGDADVMLSGGTHSMIHPFGVTGFNLLTALSTRNDEPTRASRPFDRDRDGFILGEGAGMLVLEELEHAKARGARDLRRDRRLRLDGRRLPDHRQPRRGPRRHRLHARGPRRRRLDPEDVDYINAHGTSTVGQRLDRDPGDQAGLRRRRPTRCRSPAPRA